MISGKKSCVACNIYVDMQSGGPSLLLFLWMAISPLPLEDLSAPSEKENARSLARINVNNGLVCCYDCSSEGALREMWMWRMRLEGSEKRLSQ